METTSAQQVNPWINHWSKLLWKLYPQTSTSRSCCSDHFLLSCFSPNWATSERQISFVWCHCVEDLHPHLVPCPASAGWHYPVEYLHKTENSFSPWWWRAALAHRQRSSLKSQCSPQYNSLLMPMKKTNNIQTDDPLLLNMLQNCCWFACSYLVLIHTQLIGRLPVWILSLASGLSCGGVPVFLSPPSSGSLCLTGPHRATKHNSKAHTRERGLPTPFVYLTKKRTRSDHILLNNNNTSPTKGWLMRSECWIMSMQ